MNQKYTLSQEVTAVIQESATDCIPHTRDNPQLNDREFFMKAEAGLERAIHRFQPYRLWDDPSLASDQSDQGLCYIYLENELFLESR